MISIIICSKSPSLFAAVSANINDTIGVPFEIIGIENSDGKYSICKAYNIGAAKAKHDLFCFAHEDILFITQNWGVNVINHLKDESVGLIGTLGGDPVLIVPSVKADGIIKPEANMIFVDPKTNFKTHSTVTESPANPANIKETTGIDGTLMITRRAVYDEFKYDDVMLTGFHGYDVDYSLQVQTKYKVCVVFDVLLEHYFQGGANKSYVDEMLKLTRKWEKHLPVSFRAHTPHEYSNLHWLAMERLIKFMIDLEYTWWDISKQYLYLSSNRFFKLNAFISIGVNTLFPMYYSQLKRSIFRSEHKKTISHI